MRVNSLLVAGWFFSPLNAYIPPISRNSGLSAPERNSQPKTDYVTRHDRSAFLSTSLGMMWEGLFGVGLGATAMTYIRVSLADTLRPVAEQVRSEMFLLPEAGNGDAGGWKQKSERVLNSPENLLPESSLNSTDWENQDEEDSGLTQEDIRDLTRQLRVAVFGDDPEGLDYNQLDRMRELWEKDTFSRDSLNYKGFSSSHSPQLEDILSESTVGSTADRPRSSPAEENVPVQSKATAPAARDISSNDIHTERSVEMPKESETKPKPEIQLQPKVRPLEFINSTFDMEEEIYAPDFPVQQLANVSLETNKFSNNFHDQELSSLEEEVVRQAIVSDNSMTKNTVTTTDEDLDEKNSNVLKTFANSRKFPSSVPKLQFLDSAIDSNRKIDSWRVAAVPIERKAKPSKNSVCSQEASEEQTEDIGSLSAVESHEPSDYSNIDTASRVSERNPQTRQEKCVDEPSKVENTEKESAIDFASAFTSSLARPLETIDRRLPGSRDSHAEYSKVERSSFNDNQETISGMPDGFPHTTSGSSYKMRRESNTDLTLNSGTAEVGAIRVDTPNFMRLVSRSSALGSYAFSPKIHKGYRRVASGKGYLESMVQGLDLIALNRSNPKMVENAAKRSPTSLGSACQAPNESATEPENDFTGLMINNDESTEMMLTCFPSYSVATTGEGKQALSALLSLQKCPNSCPWLWADIRNDYPTSLPRLMESWMVSPTEESFEAISEDVAEIPSDHHESTRTNLTRYPSYPMTTTNNAKKALVALLSLQQYQSGNAWSLAVIPNDYLTSFSYLLELWKVDRASESFETTTTTPQEIWITDSPQVTTSLGELGCIRSTRPSASEVITSAKELEGRKGVGGDPLQPPAFSPDDAGIVLNTVSSVSENSGTPTGPSFKGKDSVGQRVATRSEPKTSDPILPIASPAFIPADIGVTQNIVSLSADNLGVASELSSKSEDSVRAQAATRSAPETSYRTQSTASPVFIPADIAVTQKTVSLSPDSSRTNTTGSMFKGEDSAGQQDAARSESETSDFMESTTSPACIPDNICDTSNIASLLPDSSRTPTTVSSSKGEHSRIVHNESRSESETSGLMQSTAFIPADIRDTQSNLCLSSDSLDTPSGSSLKNEVFGAPVVSSLSTRVDAVPVQAPSPSLLPGGRMAHATPFTVQGQSHEGRRHYNVDSTPLYERHWSAIESSSSPISSIDPPCTLTGEKQPASPLPRKGSAFVTRKIQKSAAVFLSLRDHHRQITGSPKNPNPGEFMTIPPYSRSSARKGPCLKPKSYSPFKASWKTDETSMHTVGRPLTMQPRTVTVPATPIPTIPPKYLSARACRKPLGLSAIGECVASTSMPWSRNGELGEIQPSPSPTLARATSQLENAFKHQRTQNWEGTQGKNSSAKPLSYSPWQRHTPKAPSNTWGAGGYLDRIDQRNGSVAKK